MLTSIYSTPIGFSWALSVDIPIALIFYIHLTPTLFIEDNCVVNLPFLYYPLLNSLVRKNGAGEFNNNGAFALFFI